MTVMGQWRARLTTTAVFPTPVGPTITGMTGLGAAKSPFHFLAGKLDDGGAAMHVMRRQLAGKEPGQQVVDLVGAQQLARLDGGAARIGRGEALEPVVPAAESAPGEVGGQLLEAALGVEAGVRVRDRMDRDRSPPERLHLEARALQ